MNAQQLPNTHYFWVLPDEDIQVKLIEVQRTLQKPTLLVTWNTYQKIRMEYSEQLKDRDVPDYDCLDMFVLRTSQGKVNIMVTR